MCRVSGPVGADTRCEGVVMGQATREISGSLSLLPAELPSSPPTSSLSLVSGGGALEGGWEKRGKRAKLESRRQERREQTGSKESAISFEVSRRDAECSVLKRLRYEQEPRTWCYNHVLEKYLCTL